MEIVTRRTSEQALQVGRKVTLVKFEEAVHQLTTSKVLSALEVMMIRNELNSPKLKLLSEDDRWETLKDIWSEVKLVTGAIMHEGDLLSVQLAVLERFIISNQRLADLTRTEIIHAFYMNNQSEFDQVYRHYNKELNAEFVGDVLNAYLKRKVRMYDQKYSDIYKALNPPEDKQFILTSYDWENFIQLDYDLYRMGDAEMIFNTSSKYVVLRKYGLIRFTSKQKWLNWYRRALDQRELEVKETITRTNNERFAKENALSMYEAIKQTGVISKGEHKSVIFLSRRLVYLEFFAIISSCAINRIFEEIEHTKWHDNRVEDKSV